MAIGLYERVVAMKSPDLLALQRSLNNLATIHFERGKYQEASELYQHLLALAPDDAAPLNGLGVIMQSTGNWQGAIALYRRAIAAAPDKADAYSNLGVCLTAIGQFDEAKTTLEMAVTMKPDSIGFFNLGRLHEDAGRLTDALVCYDQALSLDNRLVEVWIQRGIALHTMGRDAEAIDDLEQALKIDPKSAKAAWNLSLCLLREGRYEEGWQLFEARWQGHSGEAAARRRFTVSQWDGASDPSGCLLIHTDQGLGDGLQMARYIPLAKAAFRGDVVVEAQGNLVRLMENSFRGLDLRIVERAADFPSGTGLPSFTTHAPINSLPHIFNTTLSTIPRQLPYLHAPLDLQAEWAPRIAAPRGMLRVGLVWRGNPQHHNDMNRSIPVEALAPLLSMPKIAWFLLQKHMEPLAANSLGNWPGVTDLGPLQRDFADTAAAVAHLDLVISVDTSVAHLAGACKRPCWVLLGWPSDWRWLKDRSSSPWYPTITLFRQRQSGDWGAIIAEVERKLRVLTDL